MEAEPAIELPYDDVPQPVAKPGSSLLSRIGQSRVYALEDTPASLLGRLAKRKADILDGGYAEDGADQPGDDVVPAGKPTVDSSYRQNAITLSGPPIEHLPTAKIFAYAAHYADPPPSALEWVSDTTVVIVYPTVKAARKAFAALSNDPEPPSDNVERLAQPVPMQLWPAQQRINKLLNEGGGLSGAIRLRWATASDVKKKGAAGESKFYKTYGEQAGREGRPAWEASGMRQESKRRRKEGNRESDGYNSSSAELDGDTQASAWRPRSGRDRSKLAGDGNQRQGNSRRGFTKDDLDAELEAFANDRDST
ncbi:hypothetical protein FRB99_003266 [Tulasnella sp. 403]|nr:hypothetical protein FRB99_003266 [Tulasnella sp. 403]